MDRSLLGKIRVVEIDILELNLRSTAAKQTDTDIIIISTRETSTQGTHMKIKTMNE